MSDPIHNSLAAALGRLAMRQLLLPPLLAVVLFAVCQLFADLLAWWLQIALQMTGRAGS
jgi:hypothetical protein